MMWQALGLYIHVPFCRRKCNYCDFYSVAADPDRIRRYADTLILDMEKTARNYRDYPVDTLFVGGGTPSVAGEHLIRILQKAREYFSCTDDIEVTCEANPESLTVDLMRQLKSVGVNRISIGAQSFCEDELVDLGRLHDRARIEQVCHELYQVGFRNINVDIMFGVGHRRCLTDHMQAFSKTLCALLSLDVPHISCYNLTVQENTPLCRAIGQYRFPGEEEEEQMYVLLCSRLAEKGYEHYEISNFAKSGYACRHNLKYWNSQPYLGFGPASHSFMNHVRYSQPADLDRYLLGQNKITIQERLSLRDLAYERLVMGLRMQQGVSFSELGPYFDLPGLKHELQQLSGYGLCGLDADRFFLTEAGFRVSNEMIRHFSRYLIEKQ